MVQSSGARQGYCLHDLPEYQRRWDRHIANTGMIARSSDLLVYAWYANRKDSCDRWLIVEWDSYCATPLREYLAPVWDRDVVGPSVHFARLNSDWWWFNRLKSVPEPLWKYGAGIAPFTFIFVSDIALNAIANAVPWEQLGNANGELRFATLANSLGITPVAHPHSGPTITWKPLPPDTPLESGIFHPVKWLINSGGRTERMPSTEADGL